MARIVFAHPLFLAHDPEEQASASPYFPLGLLYLAAWVRDRGHHVAVFDGTFAAGPADFDTMLLAERPDVVGISAVLPSREMVARLARSAHDAGAVVIVGGPDATAEPQHYLADAHVDVVVHHEGEETITALLDLHDAGGLTTEALAGEPGVAFRRDGMGIVNEPRPPIADLDELPLPARDLIDMDRYLQAWDETSGYSSITVATSRGCPYGCDWCRDAVHGAGFRQRSPASVAAEVRRLKDSYDVDRLRLVDDVDGIDREWVESWAKEAEAAEAVVPFEGLAEPQRLDLPMLEVRDSL